LVVRVNRLPHSDQPLAAWYGQSIFASKQLKKGLDSFPEESVRVSVTKGRKQAMGRP
jgi:hypothetical protein